MAMVEPMTPESPAERVNQSAAEIQAASSATKTSYTHSSHIPNDEATSLVTNSSNGNLIQSDPAILPVVNSLDGDLSRRPKDQAPSPIVGLSNRASSHIHSDGVMAAQKVSLSTPALPKHQSSKSTSTAARPHLSSPATARPSGKPWASRISLTLQTSDGTFDFDNEVSGNYLRVPDLSAFFAFFSQRSNVPLAELDCLTLKMRFGGRPQQIQVINKLGTEEEWMTVKTKIRKFFEFVRDENPKARFYIWIEIGNKNEVVCEDEEEEDLEDV